MTGYSFFQDFMEIYDKYCWKFRYTLSIYLSWSLTLLDFHKKKWKENTLFLPRQPIKTYSLTWKEVTKLTLIHFLLREFMLVLDWFSFRIGSELSSAINIAFTSQSALRRLIKKSIFLLLVLFYGLCLLPLTASTHSLIF